MSVFLKNTSFHGILLDSLFDEDNTEWEDVRDLVSRGIKSGVVQPLSFSLFEKYKIEEAFRFMASGKHIGKVLVKVRPSLAACYCGTVTYIVYIIVGQLLTWCMLL